MKKRESKFFKEFKEFISKGSVVDLAVGVIVGGAFTAIVNALVGSILTPLINWVIYLICGGSTEAFTGLDITLIPATLDPETGAILTEATVLSFSTLITATLNFVLIAFTLFCIIKAINKVRTDADNAKKKIQAKVEAKKAKNEEVAPEEEAKPEE